GSAQLRARSIRAHAAGLLRFAEKWSAVLYAVSQNRKRILSLATLATDVLAAVLAFLGAYAIRASLAPVFAKPIYPLPGYGGLLVGSGDEAERTREALEEARGEGFEPLKTVVPSDPGEAPKEAAARLKALVESERIQIVCVVPEPGEVPYLLAAAAALRDSGAAVYWAGSVAQLAAEERLASLGRVRAVLLHSPSRGLSLRVRKRASDLLLSIFVAPFRWGALRAYLAGRGEGYGPAEAWGRVWSGRLSWVGRSAYEGDR